ncbi:hypothetical protein ACFLXU_05865 [Chloroflexota bacterium]
MIVINSNDVAAVEDTIETNKLVAQGKVHRKLLIDANMAGELQNTALVTFTPGARLKFHTRDFEQVIYVTDGIGILATEKEEHVVGLGTMKRRVIKNRVYTRRFP